jgi:diguanylate cyclase (GGDEF)-like protein
MIDDGKIRFDGTPDEVQQAADPGVRSFIEGLERPRDDLTGADSQAIGQKRLLQEMSRLQRRGIQFSVVMLAMDNLIDIDRIAGHMARQKVFKAFAHLVTQNTYLADTCFRYDINKIMVLLPDTNEAQAQDFCRKISRILKSNQFFDAVDSIKGFDYSVSAGVAQASATSDLNDLIVQSQLQRSVLLESHT